MQILERRFYWIWMWCCCLFFLLSCTEQRRTTVKNYPKDRAFVFNNVINLSGKLSKDEKKRLIYELDNYWDDSLKARKIQQFGVFYKIKNPPTLDTTNIPRTIRFMKNYLRSQGFYRTDFNDSINIDTFKNQIRATVVMNIATGPLTTIDSTSINLTDSALQLLAESSSNKSVLKKNAPFTEPIVATELDRLVKLFRNNGYFLFSRDNIYAEVDTTDTELLQLSLNPLEQAKKIAEAAKRRLQSPNVDIVIKQRDKKDPATLSQYYARNIYFYPELQLSDIPDSIIKRSDFKVDSLHNMFMKHKENKFRIQVLRDQVHLQKGQLYNEDRFYKTYNSLGILEAWNQVDVRSVLDKDSIDFHFFLTPNKKQSFSLDLEGSRNTGDFTAGNLLGVAVNSSLKNRNVWHQAIQSLTNIRAGVELNLNRDAVSNLQTVQLSVGHNYSFPKFITPFKIAQHARVDAKKTVFNINAAYTDRRSIFRLRNLTSGWGYEWKKGNKVWLYRPINVELYSLDRLPGLDSLFRINPFLRFSFNTGNVVSQVLSFVKTFPGKQFNTTNFVRFGVEESGSIFGLFNALEDNIYRYLKIESEFRQTKKNPKSELALRFFGGLGYNYSKSTAFGGTMPFFKQFFAGGPNSMRAWQIRQLGQGSALTSDTISTSNFRDRFGDVQLEANIEYRFTLANFGSFKIASALFTDIGNIWNLKKFTDNPNGEFRFDRLGKDLAMAVGTGLRFDFSYFLLRFDFAYKVKDPARQTNNGWMSIQDFAWKEYRSNGVEVRNTALQLGIGLPF